jgi:hypothetical protein
MPQSKDSIIENEERIVLRGQIFAEVWNASQRVYDKTLGFEKFIGDPIGKRLERSRLDFLIVHVFEQALDWSFSTPRTDNDKGTAGEWKSDKHSTVRRQ